MKNRYYLWVCSVDGSKTHIAILMHQPNQAQSMFKDVTAFSLNDTVITAMEFVRGRVGSAESKSDAECVWMGTEGKKLLVYASNSTDQDKPIMQVDIPEKPTKILFHVVSESVFIALASGDILVYQKEKGAWDMSNYRLIKMDHNSLPITSILTINMNVYAAKGRRVFVLNGNTGDVQKSFEIQHVKNNVNLMAHTGVGLWVSLTQSSIICLYHTETFKHLQDINIAPHILRVTSSNNSSSSHSSASVYVTALMACKGLLWVGTNVGITLTVPLPRLEGLPIISENVSISYHAHCGPVTFFLPLIARPVQPQLTSKETHVVAEIAPAYQEDSSTEKSSSATEKGTPTRQHSVDVTPSPTKLRNHLPNSPIVLRRKSNTRENDFARMSKTLPRGFSGVGAYFNGTNSMRSSSSSGSSRNGSVSGCDVYGLYSDLLFVKEEFDTQITSNVSMSLQGQMAFESLRRGNSDPDLAAIPSKVSTLDRRLKMKVGRPRSLDLSNWSVDSRSSSLYTSSGSEESMGMKYRSVSRNSSNASHKFNGSELRNIVEAEHHHQVATSTPAKGDEAKETAEKPPTSTLKNRKNLKNNFHQQMVDGRRTVHVLMGGRGYVNWRNVFSTPTNRSKNSPAGGASYTLDGKQQPPYHGRSNSLSTINYKMLNSTDANIIIWEKKL